MTNQPLATRMRPRSLTEVVGQEHLIGDGKILTRMVLANQVTSIILYGKPGIGKTSIAHALSGDLGVPFSYFNAGVHTKKELQDIVKNATPENPIIAFIDEVHRLDKPKQDFLLMTIEDGSLIMVGATTENPHINLSPALRSRSNVFPLEPVPPEKVARRLREALNDTERGLGDFDADISDENLLHIAAMTSGDVRAALNTLELAVVSTKPPAKDQTRHITKDIIQTCLQARILDGDKDGDAHYDMLSAFQKSIRGSDADAALHYLGRLIQAGDLLSINRRLLVIAYEDIGLANPALTAETYAAIQTTERIGFPEARIPLAHITVRLALSAKSNVAYKALDAAIAALEDGRTLSIPKHLRDSHYKGAKQLGHGTEYKYPHNFPYNITRQGYLPDAYEQDRYLHFRDETDTTDIQKRYANINQVIKP